MAIHKTLSTDDLKNGVCWDGEDVLTARADASRLAAKAQKSVERIASWEEAVAHTKDRIKELKQSLRIFQLRTKRGDPWPGKAK